MSFEYDDFKFCCGARELGNLDRLTTTSLRRFLEDERANLKIAQKEEAGKLSDEDPNWGCYCTGEFPGAYIATTIPSQRSAIRALRANRFREVFTFTNPGTESRVTLWALKFNR